MAEPVIQSWLYLYTRSTQIPRPDPPFPNFFLYHIRVAIDPINQIYGKARTIRGWNVCVEREELSKTCESFQSQWQIGCPNLNWDHIKQTSYKVVCIYYIVCILGDVVGVCVRTKVLHGKKTLFLCVLNTILHIVIAIIIPKVILDDDDEGAK